MNLQPTSYNLQAKSGFTLIESLVAITILLIGVLGPMTAATRGITDGLYAGNQLVATYLTQEGLELLSTQIENNKKSGADFLAGLDPQCVAPSGSCAVVVDSSGNTVDFTFLACSDVNASNCQVAFDSGSGFYKPLGSINPVNLSGPVFTRTLLVETLTSNEVLLKSEVRWKNKAADLTDKVINLSRYAFQ